MLAGCWFVVCILCSQPGKFVRFEIIDGHMMCFAHSMQGCPACRLMTNGQNHEQSSALYPCCSNYSCKPSCTRPVQSWECGQSDERTLKVKGRRGLCDSIFTSEFKDQNLPGIGFLVGPGPLRDQPWPSFCVSFRKRLDQSKCLKVRLQRWDKCLDQKVTICMVRQQSTGSIA